MREVLVASPLRFSDVSRPYTFKHGVSIHELSPILWDISVAKTFVSEHERKELTNVKYWLCVGRETESVLDDDGDELYESAQRAMASLQILCPSGAKNVFLKFVHTAQGYDNTGIRRPKERCRSFLGRIIVLEEQGLAEHFDAIYDCVQRAFNEGIVRLQNPIFLLEYGQQIGNVNLSALMFVMALDMLFMAGELDPFVKRVGGFLGLDSFIFPSVTFYSISSSRKQPRTLVRDVLHDLYRFRNFLAHGQEIPEQPFRQKHNLISTDNERINYQDYYQSQLMCESSLFMLSTALRKISVDNLVDELKDLSKWRVKMAQYEHRYKSSGGTAPKKRGR